jgi:hypothetical protein
MLNVDSVSTRTASLNIVAHSRLKSTHFSKLFVHCYVYAFVLVGQTDLSE